MAGGAVTLRDVARSAKVHPSTASRALNEHTRPMVNATTVARVLRAAKVLGYEPNSLARGLKMARTFTVGMIIPDLRNPLFPPIVRGIEDVLGAGGYTVVLANSDDDENRERTIANVMSQRRVDGFILATARRSYPLLEDLRRAGTPVVLLNRTVDGGGVPEVIGDDHAGIGMAVRHLAGLGHRRIAHVGGNQRVSTGLARYQAFLSWVQSEGLPLDPDLIVFSDTFQEEAGRRALAALLQRRRDFTAVVAGNDLIALGCYSAFAEHGIRIPHDCSIVGYNDIPFVDKVEPPLTTVRIPHYQVGVKAAELLLEALAKGSDTPVSVRLSPQLVVRRSTGTPRTGAD